VAGVGQGGVILEEAEEVSRPLPVASFSLCDL